MEGLRLGCISYTTRNCTKEWKVPGDNFVIPKDKKVIIPTVSKIIYENYLSYFKPFQAGLHYDPKYWKDPFMFDPERFSPENRGKIDSATFQPFGLGPR